MDISMPVWSRSLLSTLVEILERIDQQDERKKGSTHQSRRTQQQPPAIRVGTRQPPTGSHGHDGHGHQKSEKKKEDCMVSFAT